ncbi:sialate O-acetylesterase [Fulvivirga sedimenti]|uniref:Sialate O-acetylesterase n=1 Tax=Fulvivirga sedimenti TaxID=2879465 RepID=A0A9X1KUQ5_9BACT|nr:sialate O-acetylesterase [Fulvivirga sedimenti]MCA6073758.1 sialate O-acetylesterase [Fulvivirga sedimenti]
MTLRFILILLFSSTLSNNYAQLSVAEIFTSNMVLQRDQPIHVWGWTGPNETVTVSFNGKSYSALSTADGSWHVEMPALPAGGPHDMKVISSSEEINFENILMGDVWLCSGQSNMEWIVANSNNAEYEINNSDHPTIRHYKVEHSWSKNKEEHLEGGPWQIAGPSTTGNFSAVGYFFARELQKHENVPIGLLNSSWGGSRIEPWMRIESVREFLDEDLDTFLERKEREAREIQARMEEKIRGFENDAEIQSALADGYDDSGWDSIELPGLWEESGYDGLDGIVWVRKIITLSEEEAQSGLTLHLAMVDDADETFVNGQSVGSMKGWNAERVYNVPASALKKGDNILMIQITDTGGGGGVHGDPSQLYYTSSTGDHSMAGSWKFNVQEARAVSAGMAPNQTPTVLYNKMIHPIINFPIKGVLWYQGESNSGEASAFVYRDIFKTMISDWRELWGMGDFPFLWVQLANFMAADEEPAESSWAVLRESQSAALELENTGEAVIIDIGEAGDIHPRNKQDVGLRLSLAARKVAYGEDIEYSGPVFKSAKKKGNEVILTFDHVGSGLMSKSDNGSVGGFAIAGADGKFVWASAEIEGNKVRLHAEAISDPVHVRYAWGNNPDKANLYNKEGLPARPFRADVK